jgi:hypothetical protein
MLAFGGATLVAGSWPHGAWSQEPERGESVFDRPRPDYDPLGVRAGSFLVYPKIELGESFDDNIFAVEHDKEDDFITLVSPEVDVESDWGTHAWNMQAGGVGAFYLDNTNENFRDWFLTTDGRLDVQRGTFLRGRGGWRHRHEDRGSPDDASGKEPTEIENFFVSLGAVRDLGRISASLDGGVDRLDFHDVDAVGGGNIDQDDRDRFQYQLAARMGYEYLPNTDAFVRLIGRKRKYDTLQNGVNRDSWGWAAQLGTELNFTPKITGEVHVGYQHTTYEDNSLDSVSSPAIGGEVLWNVTGLTSIRGFAEGNIEETTQAGASGYIAVRAGASVEHELRRNILVGAGITAGRDDYDGISRTDDLLAGTLTGKYLINRNFFARADVTHQMRSSDGSNDEYSRNVITLSIGAQL